MSSSSLRTPPAPVPVPSEAILRRNFGRVTDLDLSWKERRDSLKLSFRQTADASSRPCEERKGTRIRARAYVHVRVCMQMC